MALDFSQVKKWYIPVNGVNKEVKSVSINGVELWKSFTPPNKGAIISFDALGDGTTKRFRVLKVNGTTALLLSMDNNGSTAYNSSSPTTTFDDGNAYQKYANSVLDNLCSTYYNNLAQAVRNAIVQTNRVQSCYRYYGGVLADSFIIITSSNSKKSYPRITQTSIGNRYCFALDIDDVVEYFGGKVQVSYSDVDDLLGLTQTYMWFASASYNVAYWAMFYDDSKQYFYYGSTTTSAEFRPAFNIDLSQINFTIE